MTVRRAADPLPLVVHLLPLGRPEPAACTWPGAAVVAVVDPARRPRLDPALVAAGLGLTPMESRVAVLLTEGKSLREVAAATGRQETTIRWHLRQIFAKRGIARQAELVRLVLSLGGRGARPAVSAAGSCLAVVQEFSSTPSIWWAPRTRSRRLCCNFRAATCRMDHLWQAPYRVPHHAQRQSVQMAPVRTRPHPPVRSVVPAVCLKLSRSRGHDAPAGPVCRPYDDLSMGAALCARDRQTVSAIPEAHQRLVSDRRDVRACRRGLDVSLPWRRFQRRYPGFLAASDARQEGGHRVHSARR